MSAVLPSRNVDKFKDLFLGWNGSEQNKKRHFARSFLNEFEEMEKNDKGMSLVTLNFDCAWSVWSCMFDKAGYVDEKECPSLETVIKELEIQRLTARSNEPGVSFEETVTFDVKEGSGFQYECRDLYPDPECEWLREEDKDDSKEYKEDIERIYGKEKVWEKT